MIEPLLGPAALTLLRRALNDYTPDSVQDLLGPVGRAAHRRGDLAGVARALPASGRLATLVRLFLLGRTVDETDARAALVPLDLSAAHALVERDADGVRARVEVRPYGTVEDGPWWVLSDFGSDVHPGPLAGDHVLGIGAASLTLAQATLRRPVHRALDVGTGCGVQALHAATHAGTVVATDISARALQLAATTARLSGQSWELRQGSLLEPVAGEQYDLVVANPPFVVSPGLDRDHGGYDYRDSGLAGDAASAALVRGVPRILAAGGTASLLANWVIPPDGDWGGRVAGWLDDSQCDAWVWQREVVEPGAYVSLWLRDAGEIPGTPRWTSQYDRWLDWFDACGIPAVGLGLVTLWRSDSGRTSVVCEDVPQPVQQPAGAHIADWVVRRRWLAAHGDEAVLATRLVRANDVIRERHEIAGADGWQTESTRLRQTSGMHWEVESDDLISGLVAACDGTTPVGVLLELIAAVTGAAGDELVAAGVPVIRDLVGRGLLTVVEQ